MLTTLLALALTTTARADDHFRSTASADGVTVEVGERTDANGWLSAVPIVRTTRGDEVVVVTPPLRGSFDSVVHDGHRFVVTGNQTLDVDGYTSLEGYALVSEDGTTWDVEIRTPGTMLTGLATAKDRVLVLGQGRAWLSVDGGDFAVSSFYDGPLPQVIRGGDRFVAWAEGGVLAWSEDGSAWTRAEIAPVETPDVGFVHRLWWTGTELRAESVWDCCFGEVPGTAQHYDLRSADGTRWEASLRE